MDHGDLDQDSHAHDDEKCLQLDIYHRQSQKYLNQKKMVEHIIIFPQVLLQSILPMSGSASRGASA